MFFPLSDLIVLIPGMDAFPVQQEMIWSPSGGESVNYARCHFIVNIMLSYLLL